MAVRARRRRGAASGATAAILLALTLATACERLGGDSGEAAAGPLQAACRSDADCASGFCDLGACALPQGTFGRACTPPPRGLDGLLDGKLNACGAYVCSDGRCRSCVSDAECQRDYGAPRCIARPDHPGWRCGA